MTTRKQWICTTIDAPGGKRVEGSPTNVLPMGMADRAKLWDKGTALKVRFLQGEPALHDRVLQAARSWLVPGVKLDLVPAPPDQAAHFRIAFEPNRGSWSYVGRDNLGILPGQPTMNLGWATLATPDADFSSVVIHEFGHALGLLHEHNHPQALVSWNRPAVYADLEGDPNFWDKATIDANVFAKFDASSVITTDFDQASVMIYTVPSHWTTDGRSFMPSPNLSDGDAATIRKLYA
ncbi:MAG: M12 family metallopeptidase [Caldimonas sp.]